MVLREDDWYRHVAVTRKGPDTLLMRDGEGARTIQFNDDLIEIFQELKKLGNGSAIIFDRMFEKCWLTTGEDIESFLAYSVQMDDQYDQP